MRTLTYNGRLPGVAVRAAPPQRIQDPMRLDVTGFVGFAERGPLDLPVMVEDINQYRAVFGGDVPLARSKGQPVYAQLPRAVQAFFENGGRRCYVVRVASQKARANHFRLGGLVHWTEAEGLSAAVCPAASPGRWSDSVRTATRLHQRTLLLEADTLEWIEYPDGLGEKQIRLRLLAPSTRSVLKGDLLRLDLNDSAETVVFLPVDNIQPGGVGSAENSALRTIPVIARGPLRRAVAFATRRALPDNRRISHIEYQVDGDDPADTRIYALKVRQLWRSFEPDPTSGEMVYRFAFRGGLQTLEKLSGGISTDGKQRIRLIYDDGLVLDFPITGRDTYRVGSLLRERVEAAALHISTECLQSAERLTESGWQRLAKFPASDLEYVPGSSSALYRLQFPILDVALDADDVLRLRFRGGHDYLLPLTLVDWGYDTRGLPYLAVEGRALWEQITLEAVEALGHQCQPVRCAVQTFDILIRQGTERFDAYRGLNFVPGERSDAPYWPDTLAISPESANEANRLLRSMSSEEILERSTYLMEPDAHADESPVWFPLDMSQAIPPPEGYAPPLQPDRQHDAADNGLTNVDPVSMFLDPDLIARGDDGRFALSPEELRKRANDKFFTGSEPRRLTKLHSLYVVDEVALIAIPDLGQARAMCRRIVPPIVDGSRPCPPQPGSFQDCPRPQRRRDFRLSGIRLPRQHFDSAELDTVQQFARLPEISLELEACDTMDDLLAVHQAMVHMAAARGDMMAILSLPYEFEWTHVLEWHQQLTEGYVDTRHDPALPPGPSPTASAGSTLASIVQRIVPAAADPQTLSFAAAYHGWLWTREETTPQLNPVRVIPPDGPICGVFAARERARGPGVAPANVPLQAVVGLVDSYDESSWELLYNRQINIVQQRPRMFVTLSAFTLTQEQQFLQITFRRMTIWLRKLVWQEGSRFVFETNSQRFRRAVQTRFETLFEQLLAGGSILAYQIDAGDQLNSPDQVEAGRFIIEIRVAFSYPVEFITIVLVRTGEFLIEVSER